VIGELAQPPGGEGDVACGDPVEAGHSIMSEGGGRLDGGVEVVGVEHVSIVPKGCDSEGPHSIDIDKNGRILFQ